MLVPLIPATLQYYTISGVDNCIDPVCIVSADPEQDFHSAQHQQQHRLFWLPTPCSMEFSEYVEYIFCQRGRGIVDKSLLRINAEIIHVT